MKIRFHRPVGGAEAAAVTIFPVVWCGGCAVVGGGAACYDRTMDRFMSPPRGAFVFPVWPDDSK